MSQPAEFVHLQMKLAGLNRRCLHELLRTQEVHRGQTPLLLTLLNLGSCSQVELAKLLQVSAPTIAVSLKRMERVGLLRRVTLPNDLRTNQVELTNEGKALALEAQRAVQRMENYMLEGFSPEEQGQLRGYLDRILNNLEGCIKNHKELGESD